MRVLSLNTNPGFENNPLWQKHVTVVTALDPRWMSRSLVGRACQLVRLSRDFQVVLFYYDLRLGALGGFLQRLLRPSKCLVFQEFMRNLTEAENLKISTRLRLKLHEYLARILVQLMDMVIVHSSAEVGIYSDFYKTSTSRFFFVPYFYYSDAGKFAAIASKSDDAATEAPIVLAAGRHRDYQCFLRAAAGLPWKVKIVAGASDRESIGKDLPANVDVQYDISRSEYRRQIAQATIVVLPFEPRCAQRSLGQITLLEAVAMQKPVIAADTFHLADYVTDNEIVFYRAGDADDLRRQIRRLIENRELQQRLAENAWKKVREDFTIQRYLMLLLQACQSASDAKLKVNNQLLRSESA